ncbi:MAG: beta-galactosidase small subunit [Blautia sp.]|jgi:beta-galactosidase
MGSTDRKLRVIYGDGGLGLGGDGFHYIFSYKLGGMESLVLGGKEWLYRPPMPAFWRAVTDNDRGNGFPFRSGMWLGADLFSRCTAIAVTVDGEKIETPKAPVNNRYGEEEQASRVQVSYEYQTNTVPAAFVSVSYEVGADGRIHVSVHYHGQKGLPQLPVFGLRFIVPDPAFGYLYDGLSGETYPDRMAGAARGIFRVEGLPVTPYLVPQDCGVHMQTWWLEVYGERNPWNKQESREVRDIRFEAEKEPFAFSCLPYTAQELENATHQEELPLKRRTVLSILGAVRGVGGIDSWGSDVEALYQISGEQDIRYSFAITASEDTW